MRDPICPFCEKQTMAVEGHHSLTVCSTSSDDQLWNIAMLMDRYKVHEHTETSQTDESVEKLVEAVKSAWIIINVLNMSELDRGESWPRANQWLETWADFSPSPS